MGEFFQNLPESKKNSRTGLCEPVGGDNNNAAVVHINMNCKNCKAGECHMFEPIYGEKGEIIGRKYKNHPPEY